MVEGSPNWTEVEIRLPLRPNGDRRHRTVVDPSDGKTALTELLLLEQLSGYAFLQATPRTGRTHQIRAHLSAVGHPIVGNSLYRGKKIAGFERLALHASALRIRHPGTGEEIEFTAELPADFKALLARLRLGS